MPRKYFELTDDRRAPGGDRDTGTYPVTHDDYPKCLLNIVDLSSRPAIDPLNCLFSKIYDQTDGVGSNYHYQVAIIYLIENKDVPTADLQELVEYCWDWWLGYYL
ncbi:MAG: hypothetical protein ACTHLE_04240 [Agriterribacter sp.]